MAAIVKRISVLDSCTYTAKHATFNQSGDADNVFSKTIRYTNNSGYEVDFKERSGIVVATQPAPYKLTRLSTVDFEIEWRMTNLLFNTTADGMALGHPGDPLIKVCIRAFDERPNRRPNGYQSVSMVLQISIEIDDIIKAGGVVYIEELDITLSLPHMKGARAANHPFDPRERVKKSFADAVPFVTNDTFLLSLKAINNEDVAKNHDRFMLLGGQVYRIPIERDPGRQDGIHIVRRRNSESDPLDAGAVIEEHLTFEQADKRFRLYDSVEMARKMGDPEVHFKLELAEMQKQLKIDEIAQKRVEAEEAAKLATVRAELERERAAVAREKAREDLAKEKVKNFSDWMGLCGRFLLVALGALTALAKLSSLRPA